MTVHTDNKDTLINALTENEALKKQLVAANEKLRFQDAWLSDGVYFTKADYEKECAKNRATQKELNALGSNMTKMHLVVSDLGIPVGELNARIEALFDKIDTHVLMPKIATDDMLYAYVAAAAT